MVTSAVCALLVAAGTGAPGTSGPGPRLEALRVGADVVVPDTIRQRRKAFRVSDAYETRLFIHRLASYATLPLFVAEYAVGDQLIRATQRGEVTPQGTRAVHRVLAGSIAGLFAVNTVTGGLNWWETRGQPEGRTWRTAHAALMLLSDAGFVATGLATSDLRNSGDQRKRHRAIAVGSMSVATVSYLMMLKPFRRD